MKSAMDDQHARPGEGIAYPGLLVSDEEELQHTVRVRAVNGSVLPRRPPSRHTTLQETLVQRLLGIVRE